MVNYPVSYLFYKSYNWLDFDSVNLSKLRVKGLNKVLNQIYNYIVPLQRSMSHLQTHNNTWCSVYYTIFDTKQLSSQHTTVYHTRQSWTEYGVNASNRENKTKASVSAHIECNAFHWGLNAHVWKQYFYIS